MLSTRDNTTIAALTIMVPSSVLILPISCKVATVIPTEVAVIIVPIKTALINSVLPQGANP